MNVMKGGGLKIGFGHLDIFRAHHPGPEGPPGGIEGFRYVIPNRGPFFRQ